MESSMPLAGVRVVDLGQIYNAPYATLLMALAGAEVIKVEPLEGETLRRRGEVARSHGIPYAMLNSNKQSIAVDLKKSEGLRIVQRLVEGADVFIENFRPGVAARLGLGATELLELNPRLVYGSSSGFGLDSEYSDLAAMDLTIQAMAGVMDITGFPDREPVKAGPALCDFFAGIHLYSAVMTALVARNRTGRGSIVDVAMLDSVYASMASNIGMLYGEQEVPVPRTGNRHGGLATSPYNVYPATDGHIAIIVVAEEHWQSLCECMDQSALITDSRFSSAKARVENMEAVDTLVAEWTQRHDKNGLFETLRRAGIPAAPVRTLPEVVADKALRERGMLVDMEHPFYGEIVVPHSPLRFVGDQRLRLRPSDALGSSTRHVVTRLAGLDDEMVDELVSKGVLLCADAE